MWSRSHAFVSGERWRRCRPRFRSSPLSRLTRRRRPGRTKRSQGRTRRGPRTSICAPRARRRGRPTRAPALRRRSGAPRSGRRRCHRAVSAQVPSPAVVYCPRVLAILAGSVAQWLTVAAVIVGAWLIYRGGGGTALETLQTANRILERRVHDLEAQGKQDARLIAELK